MKRLEPYVFMSELYLQTLLNIRTLLHVREKIQNTLIKDIYLEEEGLNTRLCPSIEYSRKVIKEILLKLIFKVRLY